MALAMGHGNLDIQNENNFQSLPIMTGYSQPWFSSHSNSATDSLKDFQKTLKSKVTFKSFKIF